MDTFFKTLIKWITSNASEIALKHFEGIRRINHVFLQASKYLFQKSAPYPESFRENPCNSWLSTNIKPSGSGLDCDFS